MSRRGRVAKRDVLPDPIYNSKVVTKLINNIMLDGKKVLLKTSYMKHLKKLKKKLEIQQWKYLIKQSITLCLYLN